MDKELLEKWIELKDFEERARNQRHEVEAKIVDALGDDKPSEGSRTFNFDQLKLKVIQRVDRKLDLAQWDQIKQHVDPEFWPVKTKIEVDDTGVKWIAENRKDLYSIIAPAITVKPGKPGVTVERIEQC